MIAVLIGVMIGALIGGTVADRVGRRKTLVWGGILFIAGSILAPLSPNVYVLFVARTLLGIAVGFTSVTAPVYVSELAPPQSRGMLIGLYQFALTSGIALADLVGYWFAASHGWRWMFAFGLLPALLFLFMVLTVPESPRWLFAQNRVEEAELVLKSYTDEAGARVLLEDIRLSLMTKMERRWSALWSPAVRGSLFIAVGFMLLVPATGINAVLYYGPQIFSLAGISSDKSAIFATFLVAITNVLATVIALVLVDRAGRKPLLDVGFGNDGGAVLGEGFVAAGVVAVEMGVDEVFDRQVRDRGNRGLDLVMQWCELAVHHDDRASAHGDRDIPALALEHIDVVAEIGGLDLDLGEIRGRRRGWRLLRDRGACQQQRGCDNGYSGPKHENLPLALILWIASLAPAMTIKHAPSSAAPARSAPAQRSDRYRARTCRRAS